MAKILIVDDSRASRMLIRAIILDKIPAADVYEAANADEALDLFASHVPDLAILDMNMPGITGMELAEILREKYPLAKLSMLTANIQASTQADAQQLGVSFFKKPVSESVISQILLLLERA